MSPKTHFGAQNALLVQKVTFGAKVRPIGVWADPEYSSTRGLKLRRLERIKLDHVATEPLNHVCEEYEKRKFCKRHVGQCGAES